jgi:hypothetical protein
VISALTPGVYHHPLLYGWPGGIGWCLFHVSQSVCLILAEWHKLDFCVFIHSHLLATVLADFHRFYLFVATTFFVMAGFFRTLGVATSDYNVAARLASICEYDREKEPHRAHTVPTR